MPVIEEIQTEPETTTESCPTVWLPSGYDMPIVGLGTWQSKPEEVELAVNTALESGYRLIDTAYNYNNEEAIGKVLSSWLNSGKIKREDLFIVTKLPHIGNRPSDVETYLSKSLKRLQLSYVDLYLIHLPFSFQPNSDGEAPETDEDGKIVLDKTTDHVAIWKAMEEQVKAGRTKSIGLSNFNSSQIERVTKDAELPVSNLQIELHAFHQQKDLQNVCKRLGIPICAYSPLGSPNSLPHFEKKYGYKSEQCVDLLNHPVVMEIAKDHGKSPAQILLRHHVQNNIIVIPKSVTPSRIIVNFEIFDFELTQEQMDQLNALDQGGKVRIFDFKFWKGVENHPEYPF